MRLTDNRKHLLATIAELRLADLELLNALLHREREPGKYAFGPKGIERACERLIREGYLHRLWKHRDPKFRMDRGSARQIFLPAAKGALSPAAGRAADGWFNYLKDPRKEYVLDHEMMIARFHAACMKSGLEEWHQGEGTQIKGRGFSLRPDAFFRLAGRSYFLEADTGNERISSEDEDRRTIAKKIRRYGLADADEIPQEQYDIPGFSVVFLAPRRSDPARPSGRERSILQAFVDYGQQHKHAKRFYLLLSETDVLESLRGTRPLSLSPGDATGGGLSAARQTSPSSEGRSHARAK